MLCDDGKAIDRKLQSVAQTWFDEATAVDNDIKAQQKILLSPEAQTDKSENAVYQIASDAHSRLQVSKKNISTKIEAYKAYNINYKPSTFIAIGSTIRLTLMSINGEIPMEGTKEFIIKLVPAYLGVAPIGAVSIDSALGKAILTKAAGDTVTIITRKGEIAYRIEEVY